MIATKSDRPRPTRDGGRNCIYLRKCSGVIADERGLRFNERIEKRSDPQGGPSIRQRCPPGVRPEGNDPTWTECNRTLVLVTSPPEPGCARSSQSWGGQS